jgi:pimeloyl-ACP methyl ester carboxylesterase
MIERAILFGKTKSLVGILTEPSTNDIGDGAPTALLLNAGMLHRVGPNRLHVKLARELAKAGILVLRFDFSGIGDSPSSDEGIPSHERLVVETREALDYLQSSRGKKSFILIGICSGADVAFRTACCDERVAGAIMINGFYLDDSKTRKLAPLVQGSVQERYYRGRLLNPKSWWRLISGKSDLRGIRVFVSNKLRGIVTRGGSVAPEMDLGSEWRSVTSRGAELMLVYSEGSTALDTFRLTLERELRVLSSTGKLDVEILQETDHVFTLIWSQEHLIDLILRWLGSPQRSWFSAKPGVST